ncbi:MAG: ABC transporter ATP-binding protein [Myxococcales bacterium]|nr:ABC transporter ATP-binding protein [Myxococcales bacterium]
MSELVLSVDKLVKTFRKPFSRTKVEAVRGVSFEVQRGHIFGFLGPNGAGKTTTIKMVTGLIAPTSGVATILGKPSTAPEALAPVGFLPENPYIYPYLTPREFVTLCARLSGVPSAEIDAAVARSIERTGMTYAMDRPARSLSKGMLQRTGVAGAIVHDPELLILDEPMSGLDPVGRKEIRDLIVEEAEAGKTVFFSSHILSDVEMLCDSVCILKRGEVVVSGSVHELLDAGSRNAEISLTDVPDELAKDLEGAAERSRRVGTSLVLEVIGDDNVRATLQKALAAGARVESVSPKRETLEDIFVRKAL